MKQLINFSRTPIIKEINVKSNLYYGRLYYYFESGRRTPLENSEALNGFSTPAPFGTCRVSALVDDPRTHKFKVQPIIAGSTFSFWICMFSALSTGVRFLEATLNFPFF